jgi:hypothetical protein
VKLSVEDDAPKAGEGGKSDRLDGIAADLTDLLKVAVKIRLSGDDRGELRIPFDSRETLESVLAHIRR